MVNHGNQSNNQVYGQIGEIKQTLQQKSVPKQSSNVKGIVKNHWKKGRRLDERKMREKTIEKENHHA